MKVRLAFSKFLVPVIGLVALTSCNVILGPLQNSFDPNYPGASRISTFAGSAVKGDSGDGGPASSAELSFPIAVTMAGNGDLYISDFGNSAIRVVAPSGTINTFLTGGEVAGAAFDSAGNLFYADYGGTNGRAVSEVSPSGNVTIFAGNNSPGYSGDGGPATLASLQSPSDVAFDSSGNLFIADTGNNVIRKVSPSGIISTVAGDGTAGYTGNGGPATSAELSSPSGVAFDANGDLFILDSGNDVIRKVTQSGQISTFAGDGKQGYSGDGGYATSAQLHLVVPSWVYVPPGRLVGSIGIAVDSNGDVIFSDTGNNVVRMVNSAGIITTVAGDGKPGYAGDGGLAIDGELNQPGGLALGANGILYIADTMNSVIRKVNLP